ncbi:MAG: hypothetical protein KDK51_08040 [Deltaproteobacteria bacterium]|nr:hypothetical protein [Deltaproteobacteria bacterium]
MQCGTSGQTLQVLYAGSNGFADIATADVVYCVRNVPVGGVGLDENNDSIPDVFLFPDACGSAITCTGAKATGCGFDVSSSGEVTLGNVPTGFRYSLRAEFRDAAGTVLYCGQQEFDNNEGSSSVTVTIAAGTCA